MRKRARQTARSVLPNAAETKMFVTGNARAFRHFIEQRGSKHAESEIRRLAYEVWLILVKEAPNVFGDYEWLFSGPESTGGRPMDVNTRTRKV